MRLCVRLRRGIEDWARHGTGGGHSRHASAPAPSRRPSRLPGGGKGAGEGDPRHLPVPVPVAAAGAGPRPSLRPPPSGLLGPGLEPAAGWLLRVLGGLDSGSMLKRSYNVSIDRVD